MKPLFRSAVALAAICSTHAFADVCNPLSRDTCALPFPSDYWSVADASSPTGRTLDAPDTLLREEVLAQLPAADGFTPSQIFAGASGFSAASAVLFEFPNAPDAATLPKDGGNAVIAWNLTRNEPLEIRAQISEYASSDKVNGNANMIEIYPLARWPYGDRIVVAVTDQLNVPNDLARVAGACSIASGAAASYCSELGSALAQAGLSTMQARNATLFTVRDRSDVLGTMRQLIDTTWQRPHGVRNIKVTYNLLAGDNKAALVTGEIRLDSYRQKNGTGNIDVNAAPKDYWAKFRLTLPDQARDGGAPVAFYAHGLGLLKESDLLVSGMNAQLGIATFAIDFPNHGSRNDADGGYVLANLQTENIATVVGMVNQAPLDFAAAHRALVTELADLDVVGKPSWRRWCWTCADGSNDLDTSRVIMQGTSLGGVLGATYASLGYDLDAALFHVTGVGVTSILSGSILWDQFFASLIPSEANGAEALLLRAAVQHSLDYGDAINFIDLMPAPDVARAPRPLMIITGNGDNLVTNDSSVAAARLAQLPIVGEQLYPMPGVPVQADYTANGSGLRHYEPLLFGVNFGDLIVNATGHVIFFRPEAIAEQKDWMTRFFLQ